jgi:DNA-binding NarL/FixJ family response regulator
LGHEKPVIDAIEAGAQGYLLKSEAPQDLRESVNHILLGGAPISPGIARHLLQRFRSDESKTSKLRPESDLTPRERDVLQQLVKGLPYQDVAEQLGVTRNTVTTHVKSIYRKLSVSSRGEAVFEALSKGIVRVDRDKED